MAEIVIQAESVEDVLEALGFEEVEDNPLWIVEASGGLQGPLQDIEDIKAFAYAKLIRQIRAYAEKRAWANGARTRHSAARIPQAEREGVDGRSEFNAGAVHAMDMLVNWLELLEEEGELGGDTIHDEPVAAWLYPE